MSPTAAAEATDADAIRRRGDMSHLSQEDVAWTSSVADVTIVICGTVVISDLSIGMHS
jgi:hypothetical protein